ncbi:MAG: TerB family tellurite resistance protein [Ignavibacteriae bacterium]|nr:TerB family tellurite resistance protein [Ignavibacteriota bacterium]
MKPTEFQKFLFQSAVSAMAIDGEIHNSEVEEIETIVKHTAYFLDLDFDTELEANISNIKANGKDAINHYLQSFSNLDLSEKQEVILIEILLRIIEADQRIERNEIQFLQMVKSKLKTSEETLIMKFPKQVNYLIDFNNYGSQSIFDTEVLLS